MQMVWSPWQRVMPVLEKV